MIRCLREVSPSIAPVHCGSTVSDTRPRLLPLPPSDVSGGVAMLRRPSRSRGEPQVVFPGNSGADPALGPFVRHHSALRPFVGAYNSRNR